jgi:2'-5' RNA ligase
MLFPDEHGPDTCLREMARIPSGEPVTKPHVTVAYLTVPTITGRQLAQLGALAGPAVPIRAAAPFGFREDADPVFGHTLSLRIAPHPAFEWWRRAVRATIDPHGAMPEPGNLAFVPHRTAVRRLAVPPAEALTRLAGRGWRVEFMATTLIVSQRVGEAYPRRLVHRFA